MSKSLDSDQAPHHVGPDLGPNCLQTKSHWPQVGNALTLYLIKTPFNTFANRADPDQAVLSGAAKSGFTLFAI